MKWVKSVVEVVVFAWFISGVFALGYVLIESAGYTMITWGQ